MSPTELACLFADACEQMRLEYYITGSFASSYWGEYRSTNDIDVVVELPAWSARELCERFPGPEWYVDLATVHATIANGGMFNIIHVASALKVDVIMFRDTGYDNSRLSRARKVKIADKTLRISAPEDVILKKIEFFKEGGSDKHLRDIAGMFKISPEAIDPAYIDHWALRLGVQAEWQAIKRRLNIGEAPEADAGAQGG
jgi:hypothetical protein